MTRRTGSFIGWGSLILAFGFTAGALLLARGSDPYRPVEVRGSGLDLVWALAFLALPIVGAIIMSRQPSNKVGWILCGMGVLFGFGLFAGDYGKYSQIVPGADLPFAVAVAWSSIVLRFAFVAPVFLLLLFPDGRPHSPRWEKVVWLLGAVTLLGLVAEGFLPGELEGSGGLRNPTGIEALEAPLRFLLGVSDAFLGVLIVIGATSPIFRFRAATGEQRQQLKWFAYAMVLVLMVVPVGLVGELFLDTAGAEVLGTLTMVVALLGLAVAIGVAVLRYRLYDLDIVVNRTLVYVVLTGTLGAAYLGGIWLSRSLLPVADDNQFIVAATTLMVAAAFAPARRRIQAGIDHIFYRRKYDAEQTIARFREHLRDEVDLESLSRELVRVTESSMQPAYVSVWLRPEPPS